MHTGEVVCVSVYAPSPISVLRAMSAASRFPSFLFLDWIGVNCRVPTNAAIVYLWVKEK